MVSGGTATTPGSPAAGASLPAAPKPPGVSDAGRTVLRYVGSRVTGLYLTGAVLAATLSGPGRSPAGWFATIAVLSAAAVVVVAALTRPLRVDRALVLAAGSLTAMTVVAVGHPSLAPHDAQVLVSSMASSCAAGAALSWGAPAGVVATAWMLVCWLGPVRGLEGSVEGSLVAATLAGGLLGTTASYLLRRGYVVTQRAFVAAEEAVTARAVAAARWQARRSEIRILHDTVLSTLSLLAQGGQGVDGSALRADCRTQSRLLREADVRSLAVQVGPHGDAATGDAAGTGPGVPGVDVFEPVRRRWATRSLQVNVYGTADARALAGVPPQASAALLAAVEECLENVRRHAGVSVATVTVARTDRELRCTVTDEGSGFDAHDHAARRIGLRDSVLGRIEEQGGAARVWSVLGRGTSVALSVPLTGAGTGAATRGRAG